MTKPTCKLIGADSNIFNLIGIASTALRRAGQEDKAKEMASRCIRAGGHHEAIAVILEYVDNEEEDEGFYGDGSDDFEEEDTCRCGKCRVCKANAVSDYDSDAPCSCGGAGCSRCERED